MEERNTWTASSEALERRHEHDLTELAGRWNENLHVVVSLPTTVTQGPVSHHVASEEEPYTLSSPR
jgi:hypothetical protein